VPSDYYTDMVKVLPEGVVGKAEIKHFKIGEKEAIMTATRAVVTSGREPPISEGTYAQLYVNGAMVMSDTQMERRSNLGLIWNAKGRVLIAGLGLGLVVLPVAAKDDVVSITVIEQSQDVIDLVTPPLRVALGDNSSKLGVLQGDIFEWKPKPNSKWDTIYFDIWTDICTDNLKGMARLHRRFGGRKNKDGWMESWMHDSLKHRKARERKSYYGGW
jgi:hypothetical protein